LNQDRVTDESFLAGRRIPVLERHGQSLGRKENRMTYVTNRGRLEQEGLIDPDTVLSTEQDQAIESLTSEEVDALISTKAKLGPAFRDQAVIGVKLHVLLE
jgi:ABC-type amino acid transport substrate-binding protein